MEWFYVTPIAGLAAVGARIGKASVVERTVLSARL